MIQRFFKRFEKKPFYIIIVAALWIWIAISLVGWLRKEFIAAFWG